MSQERVRVGRVLKYVPAYNYYMVQVTGHGQPFTGVQAQGGSGLAGTRSNFTIPSNSMVLVYDVSQDDPGYNVCYILGAVSPTALDAVMAQADQDSANTGVGFVHDAVFNYPAATDPSRDGLVHAGNQTPIDALPGEYTLTNPIGPALHVGYFLAQIKASDRAAIQLFREGELVRVLGKEYQLHTFAEELEHHASEGELSVTRKVALLPWEALGAFDKDQAPAKLTGAAQADPNNPPTQAPIEPQAVDQRGIFRYQEHTGYLGDIYHRFVDLPTGTSGVDRRGQGLGQHQGVFHEHLGADGSLTIQSAKSLSFEKWSLIPIPLQNRAQDDPAGDNQTNYKVNGVAGAGPENPREDFEYGGRTDPAAHGMLGLELHGFAGDRMGLSTLRAHTQDIQLAAETEVPLAQTNGGLYPEYRLDPEVMWMPLPKFQEMVVQKGRWEKVRYYASRSAIQQLDDGSVVIEDGYGSQIVMSGGNVQITGPGDLLLQPGRNLAVLAPQDAVIRAGNSVDVTASRADVRLKAERNLEVLGGNSGRGGVLIESRDVGDSFDYAKDGEGKDIQGLVLRNALGAVAVVSKNLAISGLEGGTSMIQTRGTLVLRGGSTQVEAESTVTIASGPFAAGGQSSEFSSNVFGRGVVSLGVGAAVQATLNASSLSVMGTATIHGTLGVSGGVTVGGSIMAAGSVASQSEQMAIVTRRQQLQITSLFTTTRSSDTALLDRTGASSSTARVDMFALTRATGYFNDSLAGTVALASLRTDQDYHTEQVAQFLLPEARWQQFARLAGAGKPWAEPAVQGGAGPTAPWPGLRAWSQDARQLRYEERNFATLDGASTSGQEQKAAIVPLTPQVLAQAYLGNSRT